MSETRLTVFNVPLLVEGEDFRATPVEIAEMFQCTPNNVRKHLRAALVEEEITVADSYGSLTTVTPSEAGPKPKYYNLKALIAVGYRISGKVGTEFRIAANTVLRGYLDSVGLAKDEEAGRTLRQALRNARLRKLGLVQQSESLLWNAGLMRDKYEMGRLQNMVYVAVCGGRRWQIIKDRLGKMTLYGRPTTAANYLTFPEQELCAQIWEAFLSAMARRQELSDVVVATSVMAQILKAFTGKARPKVMLPLVTKKDVLYLLEEVFDA